VPIQKVKIKIQNDLIDHLSASQSVYEDVRNNFNQANRCFDALKCQKCAKIVYCLELFTFVFTKLFIQQNSFDIRRSATNVLQHRDRQKVIQKVLQNSFFDQSFSSQVFKSKSRVFESKSCLNREQKVNTVGDRILHVFRVGPHRGHVLQNSFFDRSFSSQVFKYSSQKVVVIMSKKF